MYIIMRDKKIPTAKTENETKDNEVEEIEDIEGLEFVTTFLSTLAFIVPEICLRRR